MRICLSFSTGSHYTPSPGHHCGNIPCSCTHPRQPSDRIPLCVFIYPQWSYSVRSLHPFQALPRVADQANSVPAALLRGGPDREKPVILVEESRRKGCCSSFVACAFQLHLFFAMTLMRCCGLHLVATYYYLLFVIDELFVLTFNTLICVVFLHRCI